MDLKSRQLPLVRVQYLGLNMTIKDKAKKVVGKVDEVIVKTDSTVDHALDIIKSSKRSIIIIILIVGLIIWMV